MKLPPGSSSAHLARPIQDRQSDIYVATFSPVRLTGTERRFISHFSCTGSLILELNQYGETISGILGQYDRQGNFVNRDFGTPNRWSSLSFRGSNQNIISSAFSIMCLTPAWFLLWKIVDSRKIKHPTKAWHSKGAKCLLNVLVESNLIYNQATLPGLISPIFKRSAY